MCVTFAQFIGSPVTESILQQGVADLIDAYVNYLGRGCATDGRCDTFLSAGERVHANTLEWRGGERDRVNGRVLDADGYTEVLGSSSPRFVSGECGVSSVGRSPAVGVGDRVGNRRSDACESDSSRGAQSGGVESEVSSSTRTGLDASIAGSGASVRVEKGANYLRNKESRERRKRAKARASFLARSELSEDWRSGCRESFFSGCDEAVKRDLRDTRAKLLIERNRRECAEEVRKQKVLDASDVQADIRRARSEVTAKTERNMVSIEKTHAILRANGDIPGETGFAETIVSAGSIKPSSSVSDREYHECMKKLTDYEFKNAQMKEALEAAGIPVPLSPQSQKLRDHEDGIWTDNTENRAYINEMYSDYGERSMSVYGMPGKIEIKPF